MFIQKGLFEDAIGPVDRDQESFHFPLPHQANLNSSRGTQDINFMTAAPRSMLGSQVRTAEATHLNIEVIVRISNMVSMVTNCKSSVSYSTVCFDCEIQPEPMCRNS